MAYRMIRPIGHGAFGSVYEARDVKSLQMVVCKVIAKATAPDHNAIRNEIAVLKALDHPHILRIFDHFEHGGPHDPAFYVICENLSGGDLQQEVSRSRSGLPVAQVARYIRQVLLAVNYCHSLVIPVIHRDIKPANVMKIKPGSSSDVKLIDFGLATFSKEGQGASRIGGTPEFMAPEVWSGTYGRQCDCWSIGMMLYYLLVAHFPFQRCEPSRYPRMWPSFKLTFPSNQGWGSRNLRSARDLIRKLLTLEPRMRLSAGGALKSEFIKKYGRSSSFAGYASAAMGEMMRGYQNFNATPKLTHGLRTFSQVPRVMRVVLLLTASKMDARELAKVRQVFDSIDCDHDGFISSNDMEDFLNGWMSRMGRLAHSLKSFSLPNAKTQDAATLMRLADLDEDGSIGFSEFLVAWLYANQPSGENLLRQAFNTLASVDGKVSRQEVRNALGSKQMQHLDEQLAEDIAAIFPEERLNFQRFQECLQRHEDLGPNAVQLTMRLRDNKARATWATLGQDGDDSDLDERPERSFYGACCRLLGCAQEPNPEEFEVDLVHP